MGIQKINTHFMCGVTEGWIAIWKQKTQSTKDEEDDITAVSLWKTGTQIFIQSQSLFRNVLSNIVGDSDTKANEGQGSLVE